MSERKILLGSLGPKQVDVIFEIMKEFANSPGKINYREIAKKYCEHFNIDTFKNDSEMTRHIFIKLIQNKHLVVNRTNSPTLTSDELVKVQSFFLKNPSASLEDASKEIGKESLDWDDVYVGCNPFKKYKGRVSRTKQAIKRLQKDQDYCNRIISMFNDSKRIKDISSVIEEYITDHLDEFPDGFQYNSRFCHIFLYESLGLTKRSTKVTKEEKEKIHTFIREEYENGTLLEDIALKIQQEFDKVYSPRSIGPIIYYYNLNQNCPPRKRGRQANVNLKEINQEIKSFIDKCYTVEEIGYKSISDRVFRMFNERISPSDIKSLIKQMGCKRFELSDEQKKFLETSFVHNQCADNLVKKFNEKFETKISVGKLIKEANKLVGVE